MRKLMNVMFFCLICIGVVFHPSIKSTASEVPNFPTGAVQIDDVKDLVFPSIISTENIPNALGDYYLYTAPHAGAEMRLYYSDSLEGPWTFYGVVAGATEAKDKHLSSPSAIWNDENNKLFLYCWTVKSSV